MILQSEKLKVSWLEPGDAPLKILQEAGRSAGFRENY
jgi:hypothetical protein